MYSAFERLSVERRQRILKTCLQEFAQKGYEKASTNAMVEALGIAKGLLFHYFGSKKGLYLYLWEHTARTFNEELLAHMRHTEGKCEDFFARIRGNTVVKLRTCLEYPTEYHFLMQSVTGLPQEVEQDLSAVRDRLYTLFRQAQYRGRHRRFGCGRSAQGDHPGPGDSIHHHGAGPAHHGFLAGNTGAGRSRCWPGPNRSPRPPGWMRSWIWSGTGSARGKTGDSVRLR